MSRLLSAVAAALALTVVASPLASAATPKLIGTVGPGFTITLTLSGKPAKSLRAGSYTMVVRDKSSIHDFVLEKVKGGTFTRTVTGVSFTGTKTFKVKLTRGTYEYFCAVHKSAMNGTFTVK